MPSSPKFFSPTLSVVMAVFNGAKYLNESVSSILNQTFRDFEFIIINDGSTDGTTELLESLAAMDDRVQVVHQENAGLPSALNLGVSLARGRYVARMDADDISLETRFEKQVAFLDEHPEIGVLGTQIIRIGTDGKDLRNNVNLPITPALTAWRTLFASNLAHPTVMFRREIIMRAQGYNRDCTFAQDFELWMRLALTTGMQSLPDALVKYRVYENKKVRVEGRVEAALLAGMSQLHSSILGYVPDMANLVFCLHFSGRLGPVSASQLPVATGKSIFSHFKYVKALHKSFVANHPLGECESREIMEDLHQKLMFIAYSKQKTNYIVGNSLKLGSPFFSRELARLISTKISTNWLK